MTDFLDGWHRDERVRNQNQGYRPWPVWRHPGTRLVIAQTPGGTFNVYAGPVRLAHGLCGFLLARLAVRSLVGIRKLTAENAENAKGE